jgi:hypothetical protein
VSTTSTTVTLPPPCSEYSPDRCNNGTPDSDYPGSTNPIANAFDNNDATWFDAESGFFPISITYEFDTGIDREIRKFRMKTYNLGGPTSGDIFFEGSDDGGNWSGYSEQVTTPASWGNDEWKEWEVNPGEDWHHYRIRFTGFQQYAFREIEMLECASGTTSSTTTTTSTSTTTTSTTV